MRFGRMIDRQTLCSVIGPAVAPPDDLHHCGSNIIVHVPCVRLCKIQQTQYR